MPGALARSPQHAGHALEELGVLRREVLGLPAVGLDHAEAVARLSRDRARGAQVAAKPAGLHREHAAEHAVREAEAGARQHPLAVAGALQHRHVVRLQLARGQRGRFPEQRLEIRSRERVPAESRQRGLLARAISHARAYSASPMGSP